MAIMDKDTKDHLHRQLIKLGDMMGDGLHHEPDGKWISAEYRRVMKALGISAPRRNNSAAINEAMSKALESAACNKCNGQMKQTRSGSMRAECQQCGAKYQFKRRKAG
ncbi:hypothetical protein [Vibrio parahaemolyticus]|uniref:hypothetical protein n=1 Tax=Vibrio parahaemolyticus TaxID=670 RepID=UPI001E49750C|nr:hypothetical protein [Vibrio parahaemolyticus]